MMQANYVAADIAISLHAKLSDRCSFPPLRLRILILYRILSWSIEKI